MIRIAITPEYPDETSEPLLVREILDAGWDRVHLRHPSASLSDMRRLIEAIPQRLHARLVIHGHFDLCNHFNLGGLHLNRRCPTPPPLYRGPLSRSCHNVREIIENRGLSYATLSPIFDSISKSGYSSPFTPDDLSRLTDASIPVIALGGVTTERLPLLKRYNFSGFAMLGALPWGETPAAMRRFARSVISINQ
ncbi:MAG: thiamine phosphate synthase [Staphylococcus sp.]|nr:thiamine phosphate synthase [Staphylococcus sp.]